MRTLNTEQILMILCGIVILSYLFTIISRFIKIPSVLLLLASGIMLRMISAQYDMFITFPSRLTEALGIVGLIMIVLEAGLDLKLGSSKLKLIRNAFLAAPLYW